MACTDLDKAAPAAGDDRHLHEECGVFGIYSNVTADVASLAYYALYALQHRGQESAGIVVNDDGLFRSWRDVGLVSDVFPKERLRSLGLGNIAVGHVRYGTTGSDNKRNVQPILVNHYKGRMALAHNGNLTNSQELRLQLESQGSIFHTTTDSEVIAYIIVQERLKHSSIEEAVSAAMGYARQSGIPYGMGFIKNKYIGRTFISPTQDMRENEVNIKLNPIRSVVEGKRVVLIDDSIVRGTTCRRTIDLLRKAGAKEIHMRVSAPPFVSECYYGTDIDDKNKLIANHHTIAEIAEIIGVDSLGYLSLSDVVKLADHTESGFCTACFGGGYPTSIPQDSNKDRFECKISEREKQESV